MSDRGTNIDILFRNGLEGYEVLPPPEVWDSIKPSLPAKHPAYTLLTAVASVAALVVFATGAWLAAGLINLDMQGESLTLNQQERPEGVYLQNETEQALPAVNSMPQYTVSVTAGMAPITVNTIRPSSGNFFQFDRIVQSEAEEQSDESSSELRINPMINAAMIFSNDNQEDYLDLLDTENPKIERWSLKAAASPSILMKSTRPGSNEIANILSSEQSMLSFSGGLSLQYNVNNRLAVSAGIYYSGMGQRVDNVTTFTGFEPYLDAKGVNDIVVTTSTGRIVATNPDLYVFDNAGNRVSTAYGANVFDPVKSELPYAGNNMIQNLGFIEMPLMVHYKFIDRKIDLSLVGGLSYSVLVGNSVYATTFSGEKIYAGFTEGVSNFNISSTVGLGVGYSLQNNFSFNLEPLVRYYISSIGENPGPALQPWSLGLMTGLRYRF